MSTTRSIFVLFCGSAALATFSMLPARGVPADPGPRIELIGTSPQSPFRMQTTCVSLRDEIPVGPPLEVSGGVVRHQRLQLAEDRYAVSETELKAALATLPLALPLERSARPADDELAIVLDPLTGSLDFRVGIKPRGEPGSHALCMVEQPWPKAAGFPRDQVPPQYCSYFLGRKSDEGARGSGYGPDGTGFIRIDADGHLLFAAAGAHRTGPDPGVRATLMVGLDESGRIWIWYSRA